MRQIDVDEDIYSLLRAEAEPFVDTPNSVLRRLLKLSEAETAGNGFSSPTASSSEGRAQRRRQPMGKGSRRSGKPRSARAAAGTLLPEQEYEIPLLEVLAKHGGSAPSRTVVDEVGELVRDRLTEVDHETLSSGGLRWQNRIQFVRIRLIERGLMKKDTPRGIWAISEAGMAHLAAER